MHEKPRREHRWLQRMVGRWAVDFCCPDAPENDPQTVSGVENVDADHHTLTSRVLEQDGTWKQVMTASYRRI